MNKIKVYLGALMGRAPWFACSLMVACVAEVSPAWRGSGDEADDTNVEPTSLDEPPPEAAPAAKLLPWPQPVIETSEPDCSVSGACPEAPHDCGTLELEPARETLPGKGSLLVLFDRSASMEDEWQNMPKQQAAGQALIKSLTPFVEQLSVGGVLFPSDNANTNAALAAEQGATYGLFDMFQCGVNDIQSADQIAFMPAKDFMAKLPQQWHVAHSWGSPLEAALVRAEEAMRGRKSADPLTVLIVTDGKPNCGSNVRRTLQQVTRWRDAGIPTYVVGLPGAKRAARFLTSLAQAGGTDLYLEPGDPVELERHLSNLMKPKALEAFPSCSFASDHDIEAPDKVRVFIMQHGTERSVARGDTPHANWRVDTANHAVVLEGALCTQALSGDLKAMRIEFGCNPPPPPAAPAPDPILY